MPIPTYEDLYALKELFGLDVISDDRAYADLRVPSMLVRLPDGGTCIITLTKDGRYLANREIPGVSMTPLPKQEHREQEFEVNI